MGTVVPPFNVRVLPLPALPVMGHVQLRMVVTPGTLGKVPTTVTFFESAASVA